MKKYVIYTDSACDIKPEILTAWDVCALSLTFRFTNDNAEYSDNTMDIKTFYGRMREGGIAKTSAVNVQGFKSAFEQSLKSGLNVIYIGFSSALSTTFNSARLAAMELKEEYPDRKILVVDSLSASAGQGLLVNLAVKKRDSGADIDELFDYLEAKKLSVCHWFTVDDLVYLGRGGRISSTKAFVGNLLGIKPVLHVDDTGHLVNVSKQRGRKLAITALADKYGELGDESEEKIAYISHSDCIDDANYLSQLLNEKYGVKTEIITDVGAVIGAHSGPGTLALFFIGRNR